VAASGAEVAEAPPAPLDALLAVHDRRYLEALGIPVGDSPTAAARLAADLAGTM